MASNLTLLQHYALSDESIYFIDGTSMGSSARFQLANSGDIILTLPSESGTLSTVGVSGLTNPLEEDLNPSTFGISGTQPSYFNITGNDLTLSTTTSGDVIIGAAENIDVDGVSMLVDMTGNFSIDAVETSNITVSNGSLNLSTSGSGDIVTNTGGAVSITGGTVDVTSTTGGFTVATTNGPVKLNQKYFFDIDTTTTTSDVVGKLNISTGKNTDYTYIVEVKATKRNSDTSVSYDGAYFKCVRAIEYDTTSGTTTNIMAQYTESSGTRGGTAVGISAGTDVIDITLIKNTLDTGTSFFGVIEVVTPDPTLTFTDFT